MCIRRFIALSLLISTCIAPVAAQSSPNTTPTLPQNRLDGIVPPFEFGRNVPAPFSNGQAGMLGNQIQGPFHLNHGLPRNFVTLAPNNAVCYSIRSYGFTRDNPESDMTRLSSYSTCQPSTQFEVKLVVDPRLIAPR
jgi:hypothetical protein